MTKEIELAVKKAHFKGLAAVLLAQGAIDQSRFNKLIAIIDKMTE